MATLALLDLVQRGIDYIEANLDFDIQSADVAHHAGISQWHFQRVFKALTNETLGHCAIRRIRHPRKFYSCLQKSLQRHPGALSQARQRPVVYAKNSH
jgi:transcriptional regulator GlxA family with amidase domain